MKPQITPREAALFDKLRQRRDKIALHGRWVADLMVERDQILADLRAAGYSTAQLAEAAGVTRARVWQVTQPPEASDE